MALTNCREERPGSPALLAAAPGAATNTERALRRLFGLVLELGRALTLILSPRERRRVARLGFVLPARPPDSLFLSGGGAPCNPAAGAGAMNRAPTGQASGRAARPRPSPPAPLPILGEGRRGPHSRPLWQCWARGEGEGEGAAVALTNRREGAPRLLGTARGERTGCGLVWSSARPHLILSPGRGDESRARRLSCRGIHSTGLS